jgi:predicted RND superfamily exporter protein
MRFSLLAHYDKLILQRPLSTLLVVALLVAVIGYHAGDFKLDASAESLVLEHDKDLRYYRAVKARYGSDDFLIITYTPKQELFSKVSLADLKRLRDSLLELERVESVISILDVPLINSPRVSLAQLQEGFRTLQTAGIDIRLARAELLESPLYRNLILSQNGETTALQVNFYRDSTFHSLLEKRNALREKQLASVLTPEEAEALTEVSKQFKNYSASLMDRQREDIAKVRAIMEMHRDQAKVYLGGVPMIASDMIDFIHHDLSVFGLGVLCLLIVMLGIFFRRPRWVILPMICCFTAVFVMFGYLGLTEWQVTVVSSNFTSLLLIITLSLTVHLIVRYHELQAENPAADQRTLVLDTVKTKALPSFFTALTTIIAFVSLLVSGIRPLIDFGWIMTIGIAVAFLLSFILFPAELMLLKPAKLKFRQDFTGRITHTFANLVEYHGKKTLFLFLVMALLSAVGISRLTVENRFIDHFKKSTEIYQGMEMIDRELGGTTPLDVIIDADPSFYAYLEEERLDRTFEDEFEDELETQAGLSGTSFWYNSLRLNTLESIHRYLDQLPQTGKTLSLATVMKLLRQLNDDQPLDNVALSVIYKKLPEDIKNVLFRPYMSDDGNQVRFATRVFESDPTLRRNELLKKIRHDLTELMGLSEAQVHLTGMLVLYNNMLRSLYRSQILTLGVVFLAILSMFVILFRSVWVAISAIIPNVLAAAMVLGLMGWLNIPLDIMTITIAAITIGIAVDDTIHYIHRFMVEFNVDHDYRAAVRRCHASVGRAMYYTSVTVIIGFSILALSRFMPTIYFGLLTGLAMSIALVANLTLLPLLLILFKPLGQHFDTWVPSSVS